MEIDDRRISPAMKEFVRDVLDEMQRDGRLLNVDERRWIRLQIEREVELKQIRRKLLSSAILYVIIGGIGFVGLAIWELVKQRILSN